MMEEGDTRVKERIGKILTGQGIELTPGLVHEVRFELEEEYSGFSLGWEVVYDDETAIEDEITAEMVTRTLEENRILERHRIRNLIEDDAQRIDEKGGTPTARSVLLEVVKAETAVSSSDIAEGLQEKSRKMRDWTGEVTIRAGDLAGEEDGGPMAAERDIWTDRPVLQGQSSGWETTAYGEALSCYLQRPDSPIPFFNFPEEHIEKALNELEAHDADPDAGCQ